MLKFYKVDDSGKVQRLRKVCPQCGPGIFMATHFNRVYCGKCHLTCEYLGGGGASSSSSSSSRGASQHLQPGQQQQQQRQQQQQPRPVTQHNSRCAALHCIALPGVEPAGVCS